MKMMVSPSRHSCPSTSNPEAIQQLGSGNTETKLLRGTTGSVLVFFQLDHFLSQQSLRPAAQAKTLTKQWLLAIIQV